MSRSHPQPYDWLRTRDWVELVARSVPAEVRNLDEAGVFVLGRSPGATRRWLRERLGDDVLAAIYTREIPIGAFWYEQRDELLHAVEERKRKLRPIIEARRRLYAARRAEREQRREGEAPGLT